MDDVPVPTTVVGLVGALVGTYTEASDLYTTWKRARSQQNHYRRRGAAGTGTCALSSSLSLSGPQIKETYDVAFAIVGAEFSTGDATSRDTLRLHLLNIQDTVSHLRRASTAPVTGALDLADALSVSESTRVASLQSLTEQYQRFAAGRPIPSELPVPKPRSRQDCRLAASPREQHAAPVMPVMPTPKPMPVWDSYDDEVMTTAMTITSGTLRFQSEPPSPPPTPKRGPDDLESTWGGAMSDAGGPGAGGHGLLKNSVFSIFCPEAMTLQVDVSKSLPAARKCRCGYRWKPALLDKKDMVLLKEGFRMTTRFLAKSHCHGTDSGYGCVLCTSTGRTETYESAQHLRLHINASHTKWQMLHDRDMA